jgi:phage gp16-like protein
MHQDDDLKPDYMVHEWTGEERRGIDGITLKLMAEVRSTIERHEKMEEDKFREIKQDLDDHRSASDLRHKELTQRIDQMSHSTMQALNSNGQTTREIHAMFIKAFPEGDAEGHRKAHESWIRKESEDREFWLKLKSNVINWAVIAALGWVGIAVWAAFVKGPL